MDDEREIPWSDQLENLIAKEAEKSRGYAWLHMREEQKNSFKNNYIQIPVIVFSTLSGTASVGSSSLFSGNQNIASIVVGLVSITVGILNTLGGYFGYARRAEAHRIAYLQYSQIFSWVSIELSLPRNERMPPGQLLLQLREQMKRLAEVTPSCSPIILNEFKSTFKDDTDVAKPAETNGLEKIQVFRETLKSPRFKIEKTNTVEVGV